MNSNRNNKKGLFKYTNSYNILKNYSDRHYSEYFSFIKQLCETTTIVMPISYMKHLAKRV